MVDGWIVGFVEKFGVGTALALGWPIQSVACIPYGYSSEHHLFSPVACYSTYGTSTSGQKSAKIVRAGEDHSKLQSTCLSSLDKIDRYLPIRKSNNIMISNVWTYLTAL